MRRNWKKREVIGIVGILLLTSGIVYSSDHVQADAYNGEDLALAILANQSTLVSCSYSDTDSSGNRQSVVLSSHGTMSPTHGSAFALFSTGIAGTSIVTSGETNPGSERGEWFSGGQYGSPADKVTLEMNLEVPPFMHHLYYDVQFFSTEYPEYINSQYNDKLLITVDSPSEGTSSFMLDVNGGYFVPDYVDITGTGFDVYAQSGYPSNVDWIDTTPRDPGADAGASDLIQIGGTTHPVSPHEEITITISLEDTGDNQFDSAAFIDNLFFTGFARTNIIARKTAQDINGGDVEPGDTIRYTVTISNTGTADQEDNEGDEFEDRIPDNTTYIDGSASATSGVINYDSGNNKITWNGGINAESSVSITFDVIVNDSLQNGSLISNQGIVHWDENEDGSNNADEYTDDPHTDDGIDSDGDGDTNDDDPTELYVVSFEPPALVIEDFSDDTRGGSASESYMGRTWFETSTDSGESNFEVAGSYYNSSAGSFKTKLRLAGSPQYWYYNFSNIDSFLESWQISFTGGNASEESTLYLNFSNSNDQQLLRFKFEYTQDGSKPPVDWLLNLYFWSPTSGSWRQLSSDTFGYLYNNWYTLKVDRINSDTVSYSLYKAGSLVDTKQDETLTDFVLTRDPGSTFSNLDYIEWSSATNAIVCPLFFWDDHKVGLTIE